MDDSMNDKLNYESAGQYIQEKTDYGKKSFYTFLPKPLTKVKIKIDGELYELLCTANKDARSV